MAQTVNVVRNVTNASLNLTSSVAHTGDKLTIVEETIAAAASDDEIIVGVDVSKLQVAAFLATAAMTIETNNGTTPQETITLVANIPQIFQTGDTAMFAGDVTALYVTSTPGGTLKFIALESD